jgi:hypothetical protein
MVRLVFASSLFLLVACGDDSTPSDGATSDTAGGGDAAADSHDDAGSGSELTITIVSGPFGSLSPVENAKVFLETADGVVERSSDRRGEVRFEAVDLDAGDLTLTATHPQHIAATHVGFGREVIRFYEDRGWPVSAALGEMVIDLDYVATVALSGTALNAAPGLSTLFVEPLDGDALQYRGFLALPWTIRISPQTSTTLIGWAWTLEPAAFGDRSRRWNADATFLETAASRDTEDLTLDFDTDVTLTMRAIAYTVPTGSNFFDTALPLAVLSTVTPRGQIGAIVGFPLSTDHDEATGVVTVQLGVVDPPAGEASFLTLGLEGEGSGQSSVILNWDGPPSAPIDAAFLPPPTLGESTAAGIELGENVAFRSSEVDAVQFVTYAVDSAPRWNVAYWGQARLEGEFPTLGVLTLEEILVPGALTANVAVCEFTPALCRRVASSRLFVVSR